MNKAVTHTILIYRTKKGERERERERVKYIYIERERERERERKDCVTTKNTSITGVVLIVALGSYRCIIESGIE